MEAQLDSKPSGQNKEEQAKVREWENFQTNCGNGQKNLGHFQKLMWELIMIYDCKTDIN